MNPFIYTISRWILLGLRPIYFPSQVIGLKNIPKKGAYILASNHLSYLDPVILGMCATNRPINFMAKDSLFKNKFIGWCLIKVGAFPIKRDSTDLGGIKEALHRLNKGEALVMFPEGTRGVTGRDKKPHEGVGFLAVKAGVTVIPCYIDGSDNILPKGAKWLHYHPIKVCFGRPIRFSNTHDYADISRQVVDAIKRASGAPAHKIV